VDSATVINLQDARILRATSQLTALQPTLRVDFACNNPDNGQFEGLCSGISIEDESRDYAIHYICLELKMTWTADEITLDGEPFQVCGRRCWVGNWCWDGTRLRAADAVRLVAWLTLHGCTPDQWYEEHPLGRLFRALSRERIEVQVIGAEASRG
jgi:hypothetical protein